MSNTLEQDISPSNELDSIDWTQALFRGTLQESDKDTPFDQAKEHSQEREQAQDLFAFPLNDDGDSGLRPATAHHDITGDLDRDLGFQTGDDGF